MSQQIKTAEEEDWTEVHKIVHDYLKHIATTASGAIILIVTFLDKLFKHPEWNWLVGVSLVGFLVTVAGTVAAQTANLELWNKLDTPGWPRWLMQGGLVLTWVGMLTGLTALVVFALKNLY